MSPEQEQGGRTSASGGDERRDALRAHFAQVAEKRALRAVELAPIVAERARRFLQPLEGSERALDAGTGVGTLALALATLVGEVVACDIVPELLAEARKHAPADARVSFIDGDMLALPFPTGSFDLVGTMRTLHHVERPEKAIAELVRVCGRNGRLLVIDQLAPLDPLRALELDRFERARDPSHTRTLSDQDMRLLFDMNGLTTVRQEVVSEERELQGFLDLAGCEGEERERVLRLAPGERFRVEVGWYLLALGV
jgi:ubiquinone/menaquinone biosynthesis C-methylase UbiE